jgi:putative addiction module CopG family antidote
MAITLSPATQQLLEQRVKKGEYSADEVVHAALSALDELEANGVDDAMLDALDRAEDQVEHGEVHDWTAVRDQVRARFLDQ